MADLSFIEKRKLEKLLRMESGYVLSFSDRTFRDFVIDSVERDIDSSQYLSDDSNSKAKRLRRFWSAEPNHIVGKLVYDFIREIEEDTDVEDFDLALINQCKQIACRLSPNAQAYTIEANEPVSIESSTIQRLQLIQTLSDLPLVQFEEIVFALNLPSGNLSSTSAPQGIRSSELLTWLESPIGPGVAALEKVLYSRRLTIGLLKGQNPSSSRVS